jgi:hypothetical protein
MDEKEGDCVNDLALHVNIVYVQRSVVCYADISSKLRQFGVDLRFMLSPVVSILPSFN